VLVMFEAGFVFLDRSDCTLQSLRLFVGCLAVLTLVVQMYVLFTQISLGQLGEIQIFWKLRLVVPRWLLTTWNSLRFGTMILLAFISFRKDCPNPSYVLLQEYEASPALNVTSDMPQVWRSSTYPIAATTLFLWTGVLQFFTMSQPLSALIFTVRIMISDVSRVLVVLCIIVLAFSTSLACTGADKLVFENFGAALKSLSRLMLNLDPPVFDLASNAPAAVFLVIFVLVSVIGILNVLIAQLNETYEKLSSHTRGYANIHRAQIAVEVEGLLSLRLRKMIWDSMNFDEGLEFEEGYKGPSGGIQCFEPASVMQHRKYIPDRIIRYRGAASALLPWPDVELKTWEVCKSKTVESLTFKN